MAHRIETLDQLEKAINLETENSKTYGEKYASNHEFYAVFLEEKEEMGVEFNQLDDLTKALWDEIKYNQDPRNNLSKMSIVIRRLLAEASQVAAVIDKHLEGLSNGEKKEETGV